jgi:hypothetical protein
MNDQHLSKCILPQAPPPHFMQSISQAVSFLSFVRIYVVMARRCCSLKDCVLTALLKGLQNPFLLMVTLQ